MHFFLDKLNPLMDNIFMQSTKTKTQRIIQLIPALNDCAIAREVGCSREWVRQVRSALGIPAKYMHSCSLLSEEKIAEIVQQLKKFSRLEVARRTSTSIYAITALGLKSDILYWNKKYDHNEIIGYFEKGIRSCDISRTTGMHYVQVLRMRRKWEQNPKNHPAKTRSFLIAEIGQAEIVSAGSL